MEKVKITVLKPTLDKELAAECGAEGLTYSGKCFKEHFADFIDESFIRSRKNLRILFLELGAGYNTPVIIKYPFWQMTARKLRMIGAFC